jgi:DNA polymerase-3 subunit epsilon
MDWVAIDFETATGDRASACALGVAVVSDGRVVETQRWMIQPPGNIYDPWNTEIHGIAAADTADAPSFGEMWSEIEGFVDGRLMVAHNAGFDLSVLRAASQHADVTPRDTPYACTLVLGRRHWKGLPSYSLPWICDHLGIDLNGHHNPSADATACAEIGLRLLNEVGVADFTAVADHLQVRLGMYGAADVRCLAKYTGTKRLAKANPDADPEHPFYGVRMVFTGALSRWTRAEAADLAAQRGASCVTTVSGKTDYLVVGIQDPGKLRADGLSGKLRKAADLAAGGAELQILTEAEFESML